MAVNLSPYGGVGAQFLDNSGNVLTGGKIYTYAAGTTTPQATYTNATGAIPQANPLILDAAGRVPSGEIWLTDGLQYKFVLKDSNDVLIGTYDNVIGINSNFVNYAVQEEIQTATAGQTVFNLTTINYTPGTNSLSVFVDGVNQYDGVSYAYVETDSDTVTFTSGLHVGALVKFTTAVTLSSGVTTADLVSYDPPFPNSVPTTVENKLAESVSVLDFGAAGDGVTDDTVAIQNAINATAYGGTLHIPAGSYLVSASLEVINKPIRIVGDGFMSTYILASASIPGTDDVLVFNGDSISPAAIEGYYLSDISIKPQLGTPARHGLNLGNGIGVGINRATVERVKISGFGSYAIRNNGAFSSTIQNCFIEGILFDSCTDNQNVLNNTIFGVFWGVYINAVVGTNMFNIKDNVIVSELGGVYAVDVGTLTIADNQFETQAITTDPESSMIVLKGTSRQIYNTQIHGNNFNVNPAYMIYTVRLYNTLDVSIYGNSFSGGLPYPDSQIIKTESNAIGTVIGENFVYSTQTGRNAYNSSQISFTEYNATYFPSGRIVDSGVGTAGIWKLFDLTAYPDTTRNANYSVFGYKKNTTQNEVVLRGGVNLTNISGVKGIAKIPDGFRPFTSYNTFTVPARDSSNNYYTAYIRIDDTGTVILVTNAGLPTTVELCFDNVKFSYYYN